MVPSRLRHPWDFYSKRIFLTLFFFFSKRFFTIVTKDSAAKGETALGMRKEITNPIQARWCQAGWFLKAVMVPLGCGARGPDGHVSTAILCDGCVGHMLNPAQVKYQTVPQTSSIF